MGQRNSLDYHHLRVRLTRISYWCYPVPLTEARSGFPGPRAKFMDVILRQLGQLLLKAVPTFLLVVFLSWYLKFVFFRPLEKVLRRRYDLTEGARKLAEEMLTRADAKAAEYEAALRAARAELYEEQERMHKRLQEEAAAQIADARRRAEAAIEEAARQIAREGEAARASLERQSDALADQIVNAILRRSAA